MNRLKGFGLVYVASPYTKYPLGLHAAFVDVARITGSLVKAGVKAYSPIAHGHPIAVHAGISLTDHEFWMAYDHAMIERSDACVIAELPGWANSRGVCAEIVAFRAAGKPIFSLIPDFMAIIPYSEGRCDVA